MLVRYEPVLNSDQNVNKQLTMLFRSCPSVAPFSLYPNLRHVSLFSLFLYVVLSYVFSFLFHSVLLSNIYVFRREPLFVPLRCTAFNSICTISLPPLLPCHKLSEIESSNGYEERVALPVSLFLQVTWQTDRTLQGI